jgi:hypothetical protein
MRRVLQELGAAAFTVSGSLIVVQTLTGGTRTFALWATVVSVGLYVVGLLATEGDNQ